MMPAHTNTSQRGNVLWFILIAVALLAALTMILTRSGSTVDQTGDVEQQTVLISQMLRYAKSLESGIQELRLRGVSENDISFQNAITAANYTNANCTTTDCRLFDVGGAGLSYQAPPNSVSNADEWIFTGDNDVLDVGTTNADLVMILPEIRTAICAQINRMLDTTYAGTETDVDFTEYTGSFTETETIDQAAGQEAGCVNYDNSGSIEPFFYYVLIKR